MNKQKIIEECQQGILETQDIVDNIRVYHSLMSCQCGKYDEARQAFENLLHANKNIIKCFKIIKNHAEQ